uniref:HTH psq-type domain-containing protein n=1 Tax=Cyprinodon variegatus TaxID=28743 RepID=A0A3Q2GAR2_CYPVA
MTGKRKTFSNNEKCSLLKAYDKLPKTSQREAVAKLGIPQATFCTLIKQRDTVMNPALVKWIDHAWSRNAAPSVPLVREKAESLATTQEDSFKRENIVFKKLHGEAAEAEIVQAYSEESICNADETRIYFRALPDGNHLGATRCFNVGTSAASSEEEEDEEEETVVPSRAEMRNAVCILKTGLLHIGFKNFDLLHHFEKEVNLVLKNTLIQGTMDKYVK